jgi:periodic tryptophan protein 1
MIILVTPLYPFASMSLSTSLTFLEWSLFDNLGKHIAVYQDNQEDPYITVKDEVDDEELQDILIQPNTDHLILVGKTEETINQLEVYVYDAEQDNLYVHHDMMLPSFPLCVEPIHFNFGTDGTLLLFFMLNEG